MSVLWARDALSTAALLSVAYAAYAWVLLVRFSRRRSRRPSAPGVFPAVSVLKPLEGPETDLYANLETLFRQRYPGPVQIVFGVARADDPALDVVARLRSAYPTADVAVSTTACPVGVNPKVNNLTGMLPMARYDLLVLADSDVIAPLDYLEALAATLALPHTAGVTCLYRARPVGHTVWSHILAAYIDGWFRPSVLVGLTGRRSAYGLGATIAIRREALAAIGGLARLGNVLADDFWLGEAIARQGGILRLSPSPVTTAVDEPTWGALWSHQLRWNRTSFVSRPWGHAFSFLTFPIALTAANAAARGGTWTVGLVGLALVLRGLLLAWDRDVVGREPGKGTKAVAKSRPVRSVDRTLLAAWLLMPVTEALVLTAWAVAIGKRHVMWRGRRYRVTHDGRLTLAEASPGPKVSKAKEGDAPHAGRS